jgi:hypothetical protein
LMSDLFASLVDRALDRAPVLQRRQPTLFEPVAPTSLGEQSRPENRSLLEEKEAVVESRPSLDEQKHFVNSSARLPQPSLREETESEQPVAARPVRRRHNIPPPTDDRETDLLEFATTTSRKDAVKTIDSEEFRRESKSPIVAANAITNTPAPLIETIVERRVEREIVRELSANQPAIKEVHILDQPNGQQPKPERENDGAQTKQPLPVEVKQLISAKEAAPVKPLIQQKPPPPRDPPPLSRAAARAQSRQSPRQPTPPVIHVTIGRVEVRATPPATNKSRPPQPVGPRMSLEDYLRSRGNGN